MSGADLPRVTFGIIVLNGEPFARYCLRGLYPFAHEIIVVEGATPAAAAIATTDGHSIDSTVETLDRFKAEEDPEGKIRIVSSDGFWSGKDEQSQAYAERATGDYLWQVDIDEFYHAHDMLKVLNMLRDDPQITAVSFKQVTFWGGLDYTVDGWYLRQGAGIYHRLFKWGPGYQYASHRPPTVKDPRQRDLRQLKWVGGHEMNRRRVQLYHYSLLFPKQVAEKAEYYAAGPWGEYSSGILNWARENFLTTVRRPFLVHNVHTHPSWLRRFGGQHPEQARRMLEDIEAGKLDITLRDNRDVHALLSLPAYAAGRWLLERISPVSGHNRFPRRRVVNLVSRVTYDDLSNRLELS